jgi:protein required for attachment to host cells/ribosome-associated translation inhibitor RaiA
MAAKIKTTWIAVLDAAQARFFTLRKTDEGQVFEKAANALNADLPRHARDEGSDKPGRSFSSAGGGVRHALEPRSNPRKLEKHNFTREVADALDAALGARRYTQLVLVAPPRSLGELREVLSERVLKAITQEIPKSLTNLPPDVLWSKLSVPLMLEAKTIGAESGPAELAKGAPVPVSVVFRNMEASPTVRTDALRQVEKLGRKFGRILNCRVTVDASRHPHRKVRMFRVSVDLKLPGHEIAAKNAIESQRAQEDVKAALHDAFVATMRQLKDYAQRMKDNTVEPRRVASLRALEEAS